MSTGHIEGSLQYQFSVKSGIFIEDEIENFRLYVNNSRVASLQTVVFALEATFRRTLRSSSETRLKRKAKEHSDFLTGIFLQLIKDILKIISVSKKI